jgi:hypothetical protein
MKWLLGLWHKRQRAIDIQLLWPSCRDHASDLDLAKAAFALHAFRDHAWLELGEAEIYRIIDGLH